MVERLNRKICENAEIRTCDGRLPDEGAMSESEIEYRKKVEDSVAIVNLLQGQGFEKFQFGPVPAVASALATYLALQTGQVYESTGSDFVNKADIRGGDHIDFQFPMIGLCRIVIGAKTEYYCALTEITCSEDGKVQSSLPKYFEVSAFMKRVREGKMNKPVCEVFNDLPRTEITPTNRSNRSAECNLQ
ncbi:MAG: hypothetical protein WC612_08360 [Bdellovibrionales bacterium]|jgi:hypothetical protein